MPPPDRARMEAALQAFLDASGLSPSEPHLQGTAARVTEAWVAEFLAGYATTPQAALGELYPVAEGGGSLVVVTGLEFRSMCPHHLLPYRGTAHVAYLPGPSLVGFGRLSALVDALAHRLTLQEDLARQVASALITDVGARGAACLVRGEHACLRDRGEEQAHAVCYAETFLGALATDQAAQAHIRRLAGEARGA